jgi:hypothetical protein
MFKNVKDVSPPAAVAVAIDSKAVEATRDPHP